ncbi:hypothetical protein FNV43_RR12492 [Rhamnella rubrinervis]|uniref:Uncharacterized protein n=1 Tax=Rhamnella rubrinervis TaxID=2594499 RepID=A0A8K0MIV5_9ROSA|nr:hypothetical protein FNV43_RR12492 [Rhamnella rubrinervis]
MAMEASLLPIDMHEAFYTQDPLDLSKYDRIFDVPHLYGSLSSMLTRQISYIFWFCVSPVEVVKILVILDQGRPLLFLSRFLSLKKVLLKLFFAPLSSDLKHLASEGRDFSPVGLVSLINQLITSKFVHTFMIYKWPTARLSLLTRPFGISMDLIIMVWKSISIVCCQGTSKSLDYSPGSSLPPIGAKLCYFYHERARLLGPLMAECIQLMLPTYLFVHITASYSLQRAQWYVEPLRWAMLFKACVTSLDALVDQCITRILMVFKTIV